MNTLPVFSSKTPSDEFENLIVSSGSPVVDCGHCGRTIYDSTGEHMDDGELEGLQKKHQKNPDRYIPQDDAVHWGYFDGKQTVCGCPCNAMRMFEELIWGERHLICKYIESRAREIAKKAQETLTDVDAAQRAIAEG